MRSRSRRSRVGSGDPVDLVLAAISATEADNGRVAAQLYRSMAEPQEVYGINVSNVTAPGVSSNRKDFSSWCSASSKISAFVRCLASIGCPLVPTLPGFGVSRARYRAVCWPGPISTTSPYTARNCGAGRCPHRTQGPLDRTSGRRTGGDRRFQHCGFQLALG